MRTPLARRWTQRLLRRTIAPASLLALLAAGSATAQRAPAGVLDLRVVQEGSGRPVADAVVRVSGVRSPAWTDAEGRARVGQVPVGRRLVTIDRAGYVVERMTIGFGGGTVTGEVELRILPVTLAPVEVVAREQRLALRERGFYRRQREGQGAFITRAEIERYRPIQTVDLFRRIRGFTVVIDPGGKPHVSSARGPVSASRPCVPQMYVDGIPMGPGDPDEFVAPHHLEAMEAYSGPATIPPEYNQTGSACGVVLFWTRNGR